MKKIIIPIMATLMLVACHSNYEKDLREIEERQMRLSQIEANADTDDASQLADLYLQFAAKYPDDSLAPVYMMRSAEILANLEQTNTAIAIYDSILSQYPGFEDIGGCLFMKGSAYEQAEQYDSARAIYTRFVEQYPDHVLAPDTRKYIPMVGMSADEMFEQLIGSTNIGGIAQ